MLLVSLNDRRKVLTMRKRDRVLLGCVIAATSAVIAAPASAIGPDKLDKEGQAPHSWAQLDLEEVYQFDELGPQLDVEEVYQFDD